ncbi:MAG: M20/M25/M40 family metallo-hydrolase [Pyrinomonadaceae bacterium]
MFRHRAAAALLFLSLLSPHPALGFRQQPSAAAQTPPAQTPQAPAPQSPAAQDPVERIKDEGLNRSQVMQTVGYLTDVIGPRLTNSPAMKRANNWTRDKLAEWGLKNARLEPWGPFGRGWTLRRFSAEVIEPQAFPLLAYPKAWSPGTDGPLAAEVFYIDADTEEKLQQYRGKLKGAIVLAGQVRELKTKFDPVATRLTDKELLELADAPDPATVPRRPQRPPTPEQIAAARFNDRKTQFYYDEGVALLVTPSPGGDGGMLQFVQSASVPYPPGTPSDKRVGPWDKSAPKLIPQIGLSNDHFNRFARMLRQGEKIRMAANLAVEFHDEDLMGYNTVAEIPGTDLKDEVVMLGAHLDSWHTATGATDNAAGVAIMMEAVRILQALNLQPRRTIRVALWSGEEQGLRGSRAYIKEHFGPVEGTGPAAGGIGSSAANSTNGSAASSVAPVYKPAYDKFNVYFNADSGTGRIRGIYLQGNEALRPIFRQWLQPFREMGASTITVSNAGGSDFLAFDAVGLVGLDFLQDEIEYAPRTWHSNQDTLDRVIADDLKQAAVIAAAFAYNAATTEQRLPRKPAPAR